MGVKRRIAQVVASLVFAAIFGVLAWQEGIYPIGAALYNGWRAADYVEVKATVAIRERMDADGPFKYLVLRYEHNGKHYETTRMSVLRDQDTTLAVNAEVIDRLRREDGRTSVWVDPRRPDMAVASRDLPWSSLWPLLPLLVAFVLLSAAGLMSARHARAGHDMLDSLLVTKGAGIASALASVDFAEEAMQADELPSTTFGLGILVGIGLMFALMAFIGAMRPNASSSTNDPSG